MSDRLIPFLSLSCGTLTLLYIMLVGFTILFATMQTNAMNSVQLSEGTIGNLEATYYTDMDHASTLDPQSLGYVTPVSVQFVTASENSSFAFAKN
jgi:hypothetical protein